MKISSLIHSLDPDIMVLLVSAICFNEISIRLTFNRHTL